MPQSILNRGISKARKPSGSRAILAASDFTYLGQYGVDQAAVPGLTYGAGLTHRYVGGQLRFLAVGYNSGANDLFEFALPAGGYGGTVSTPQQTATWSGLAVWPTFSSSPLQGHHFGIHWEDQGSGTGRLWGSFGIDYGSNAGQKGITRAVTVRNLGASGTVSGHKGPYGFQGVSQRCVMGRVLPVPAAWRSAYGLRPYLYGLGGYASLVVGGGTCSLGSFWIDGPDVSTYSDATSYAYGTGSAADYNIAATEFAIVADHRSGNTAATDWYGSGSPTTSDCGATLLSKKNWFFATNGDLPANGAMSNAAVGAYYDANTPAAGSQWTGTAPDGRGRMTWSDSYYSNACAVEGASKRGLVCVASLNDVWAGYVNSTVYGKKGAAEIHVFDPADLGHVKAATLDPCRVQPVAYKDMTATLAGAGIAMGSHGSEQGGPVGCTFDPATSILWTLFTATDGGYGCSLVAYSVNC